MLLKPVTKSISNSIKRLRLKKKKREVSKESLDIFKSEKVFFG